MTNLKEKLNKLTPERRTAVKAHTDELIALELTLRQGPYWKQMALHYPGSEVRVKP